MSQPDTKERILDAAESLFSREGFHSTSLRAITASAGANLAAVNYHFGSKEALLDAVFERRLRPLNGTRQQNLERILNEARERGVKPRAESVLRAFVEPTLAFGTSGPAGRNFVTLVGHALAEPDDTVRNLFIAKMRPIFHLLFEALCLSLPDFDRNLVFWRMNLALGAISHTLCWGGRFRENPQLLPEGVVMTDDADNLTKMLVSFLTAGMEAPCN